MYMMYLFAIASAYRTIHLTNPYFVPDAGITDALLKARGRGVKIVLLLPGPPHEILPMFDEQCVERLQKIVPVQHMATRVLFVTDGSSERRK